MARRRAIAATVLAALTVSLPPTHAITQDAQPAKAQEGPGQPPSAEPNVVTAPIWLTRPSSDDFAKVFPREARKKKVTTGRATLGCLIAPTGNLIDCEILTEDPAGHGFGEAILKLAPLFRMGPVDRANQPTAGKKVRVPMVMTGPG